MPRFSDVRQTVGVPPASAFSSAHGTPLVVDIASGTIYYMDAAGAVQAATGGGGGGAPTGASYLTLGLDGGLTAERVLTAGTNITFVDTGANGTLTINASGGGSGLTQPQVMARTLGA